MKNKSKVLFMAQSAVIAALYVALTYVSATFNLAYTPVQFRVSEMLTLLPVFTPAAIPGLVLGCFIANLMSPLGIVDWIFGSGATLLAAVLTYYLRNVRWGNIPWLSFFPPVLCNAAVIGWEISCLSDAGKFSFTNFNAAAFWPNAFSVGLGELLVCFSLGLMLVIVLQRTGLARRLFSR